MIHRQMLVGGHWVDALGGATFERHNPATGQVVGAVPLGGAKEARHAVDAATDALPGWRSTPARDRARILHRAAELLLQRSDEIAPLITQEEGKPITAARKEVAAAAELLTWYAEEGRRAYGQWIPDPVSDRRLLTIRQPVGVAAAITPWNVPVSMIARKVGPALAAGCTVVVKPAEQTPLSGLAVAEVLHEAGAPAGVVNVITGDAPEIGQALLADERVRKISFTGSTEVGRLLMRGAAAHVKRVSLELGGSAPFLVLDDADLDLVARDLASTKFRNAGQACVSPNRVLVARPFMAELADRLADAVAALRVGNGLDEATDVGPLVEPAGVDKVEAHVKDALAKGARGVVGGRRLTDGPHAAGHFYAPTVLADVTLDMLVTQEETFGPVAALIPVDDLEQAIAQANDTPFGLAAYLYTRDISRAVRVAEALEFGMVGVNDSRIAAVEAPFGGVKSSGIGREGGHEGLDEFLETKLIALGVH